MAVAGLVGRDAERQAIRGVLDERGGLVLTGPPGIGKTVLWQEGVGAAEAEGWHVLRHRSVQAETGVAFAGLSDLVEPVLERVADRLAPPRRAALEVALGLADAGTGGPHPHALGLGLRDVLELLAVDAPVLVALDDVQWLDPSSATVVGMALRRVDAMPVAVLATARTERDAGSVEVLPGLASLSLAPLDLTGVHRLLRDRLGLELPRPALVHIHRVSGGNPYFALELARDGGEHVPESLRALLGGRLDRLPAAVGDVLLEVSALARPTVELLDGSEALDLAVLDGIVAVDGSEVRFAHPLLASLCYDRAPPGRRRAVHARLAERVVDADERARHRSLAAGGARDAELALELEAAGSQAAARGATAAAAELLELAVRHTPEGDDTRDERRLAAAGLHQRAGDLERAGRICAELASELPRGRLRARALYAQSQLRPTDSAQRVALCEQALEELDGDDALGARILGYLAFSRRVAGDVRRALADVRAALARAEQVGDELLLAATLARVGNVETWALEITPGVLERGVEIERRLDAPLTFHESPASMMAIRAAEHDDLDLSRALISQVESSAERAGDEQTRAFCRLLRINVERHAGRLDLALEHAAATRDLGEQLGDPQLQVVSAGFVAATLADLGRVEEAETVARECLRLAVAFEDPVRQIQMPGILGRLALLRDDVDGARRLLDELPERTVAVQRHPTGMPWPEAIEALVRSGELSRAAKLLEQFDELAARASRLARAMAGRCRGLLRLAEGDPDGAVAAVDAGLAEEGGTYPFERARLLVTLGVAHRHAGRKAAARAALDQAIAVFEQIGSTTWREQAEAELARVSGRRAQGGGLTQAELRVAELAALGRQNKEIAAMLFLSVGTVEMHLTRVYRKLGVRSRTELAKALEPAAHA